MILTYPGNCSGLFAENRATPVFSVAHSLPHHYTPSYALNLLGTFWFWSCRSNLTATSTDLEWNFIDFLKTGPSHRASLRDKVLMFYKTYDRYFKLYYCGLSFH